MAANSVNGTATGEDGEQLMDMIEFFQKVQKSDVDPSEVLGEEETFERQKTPTTTRLEQDRKTSEDITRKMLPALRMKAFCKQRQETFHSLEAFSTQESQPLVGSDVVSSPQTEALKNTPTQESDRHHLSDDILRMPAIESLRIASPSCSSTSSSRKVYQKNNSDPTLVINKFRKHHSNENSVERTLDIPLTSVISETEKKKTPPSTAASSTQSG